ncbi:hypothetical protein ACJBUE_13915 [Ralstonia syzygii subsp. celebesensis]|uniref:hypothetical protein n=1 Tax=Ralstonia syzygii TaxID=28097 RepID=UPI001E546652|nr:hypothetical protein [Ralstonia syzygii]
MVADILTGLPTVVSVCTPKTEVWLLTKFLSAAVFALPTSFFTLPVNFARPDLPDFWGAAASVWEAPPVVPGCCLVAVPCDSRSSARKSLRRRCTRVEPFVSDVEGAVTAGREDDEADWSPERCRKEPSGLRCGRGVTSGAGVLAVEWGGDSPAGAVGCVCRRLISDITSVPLSIFVM